MTCKVVVVSLLCLNFIVNFGRYKVSEAQKIPTALYIFGDSLVDVGNNNHLPFAFLKANFPYGVDFTPGEPTGRFSNGQVISDFLAEKLGVDNAKSFLSEVYMPTKRMAYLHSYNFASAGAELIHYNTSLFDNTISLSMTKQVDYFTEIKAKLVENKGKIYAKKHIHDSIFTIAIGSDDIYAYFQSPIYRYNIVYPTKHLRLMALSFKQQLNRLYNEGARKFVVIGVDVMECNPFERIKSQNQACNEELNSWSLIYYLHLRSILVEYKSKFKDMHYSLFDTYSVTLNFINNASAYGFVEVKAACCGYGTLNAATACSAKTYYCTNRTSHLYWDGHHLSEAAHRILVDHMYCGTSNHTYPMNIHNLVNI